MPLIVNPPPPTPVDPVTEILHGVSVTDPYRWLEDANSLQTRQWLDQQTGYTRAYLEAIPNRKLIRQRVEELLAVEVISAPRRIKNRDFFLKRKSLQQQPVIMMHEHTTGEDTTLVDPAERNNDNTLSFGILGVSNDGNLLAYSVRYGGEDTCAVEFLDVNRRARLADSLPRGRCRGFAFAPDGSGFYYVHGAYGMPYPHLHAVNWHAFGTDINSDSEVFSIEKDPTQ